MSYTSLTKSDWADWWKRASSSWNADLGIAARRNADVGDSAVESGKIAGTSVGQVEVDIRLGSGIFGADDGSEVNDGRWNRNGANDIRVVDLLARAVSNRSYSSENRVECVV